MPGTLTKADIITAIQTENGYSLKKSSYIVETLLEIIKSTLASGEDILISGFGKFNVKDKKERRGRNPATDEDMVLPARKVVTFKCSGNLRDRIITLGFFTFVINAILLMMASGVIPGFEVAGFWSAVFGSLFISLITWFITSFINERSTVQYIDLRHKGDNR